MPTKNNPKYYAHSLLLLVYDKCQELHRSNREITILALIKAVWPEENNKNRAKYYRIRRAIINLENTGIIQKREVLNERKLVTCHYNLITNQPLPAA